MREEKKNIDMPYKITKEDLASVSISLNNCVQYIDIGPIVFYLRR